MSRLRQWNEAIVARRKESSWEQFVQEICSWYPLMFYKQGSLISVYPQTERVGGIVSAQQFEADREQLPWVDGMCQDGFFATLQLLFRQIQFPHVHHFKNTENGTYANYTSNAKNPYLSFHVTGGCENVLYSLSTKIGTGYVMDSVMAWIENNYVYSSSCVMRSSEVFWSKRIENCRQVWLCTDLIGCEECVRCHGLRNQSYCIDNQPYDKDTYLTKKQELLCDSVGIATYYQQSVCQRQVATLVHCEDVTQGSYSYGVCDGRNVLFAGHRDGLSHAFDAMVASGGRDYAGVCSIGGDSEYIYCSVGLRKCFNLYYCFFCEFCSFCVGCVGLKNKSYCIFNKQYEKDEWYEQVDKIFQQMTGEGSLGDFLPGWLCPFFANDTAAAVIGDANKQRMTDAGFLWREKEERVNIPEGMQVVKSEELGKYESMKTGKDENIGRSGLASLDPEVLKVVIQDKEEKLYRLIPMEYKFLKQFGLPLPRQHWMRRLQSHFVT